MQADGENVGQCGGQFKSQIAETTRCRSNCKLPYNDDNFGTLMGVDKCHFKCPNADLDAQMPGEAILSTACGP